MGYYPYWAIITFILPKISTKYMHFHIIYYYDVIVAYRINERLEVTSCGFL